MCKRTYLAWMSATSNEDLHSEDAKQAEEDEVIDTSATVAVRSGFIGRQGP